MKKTIFAMLLAAAMLLSLCACSVKKETGSAPEKNADILSKANLYYSATAVNGEDGGEGEPDFVIPPEGIIHYTSLKELEEKSGFPFDFDFIPGTSQIYVYIEDIGTGNTENVLPGYAQAIHYFDLGSISEAVYQDESVSDLFHNPDFGFISYGNDGMYDISYCRMEGDAGMTWRLERQDDAGFYHIIEFCIYSEEDAFVENLVKLIVRE